MKAIEFLDGLQREALDLEVCGLVHGYNINANTPKAFFGIIEDIPGDWFADDSYYFYFYGPCEYTFGFLPNTCRFFPTDAENGVYVWIIEN